MLTVATSSAVDSGYFVSGSFDRTCRLWSTDRLFPLRTLVGHNLAVETVKFHPNQNYFATGSADKTVRLWTINDGNNCWALDLLYVAPVTLLIRRSLSKPCGKPKRRIADGRLILSFYSFPALFDFEIFVVIYCFAVIIGIVIAIPLRNQLHRYHHRSYLNFSSYHQLVSYAINRS